MDIKRAKKFMTKQIEEMEKSIFTFENVLLPRFEQDRKVLLRLKEQYVKMSAFQEKVDRGETVTNEDVYESVPPQFR